MDFLWFSRVFNNLVLRTSGDFSFSVFLKAFQGVFFILSRVLKQLLVFEKCF